MQPSIVILAAGAGSRYGGLKQLEPVGPSGEALLEYSVFDALEAGFSRAVLVVRQETEPLFRARLDETMGRRLPIDYVHQRLDDPPGGRLPTSRKKPWGTAHAVLAAEPLIDGPFAVVNADDFYGAAAWSTLSSFLFRSGNEQQLAAVGFGVAATLPPSGAVSRALLTLDAQGNLARIVELPEVWRSSTGIEFKDRAGRSGSLADEALVSMNMWAFRAAPFDDLRRRFLTFLERADPLGEPEFLLPEVVQSLVTERLLRVGVLAGGDEWCGLTHHSDRQRVESFLSTLVARGRYPETLWEKIRSPGRRS